jgi:hypothetical protein
MRDNIKDYRKISLLLDNCYLDYQKISEAPNDLESLLNKYGRILPDFKHVSADRREEVQEKLNKDIKYCKEQEMKETYKSTDGVNVYAIKNPYIWPMGKNGLMRVKPRFLGLLESDKKTTPITTKRVAFNYHSSDDLE